MRVVNVELGTLTGTGKEDFVALEEKEGMGEEPVGVSNTEELRTELATAGNLQVPNMEATGACPNGFKSDLNNQLQ